LAEYFVLLVTLHALRLNKQIKPLTTTQWLDIQMNTECVLCYRILPLWSCVCSFPSAQQACRSFFRVIYVGGLLKGPQSTTTAHTLTHTRFSVFL